MNLEREYDNRGRVADSAAIIDGWAARALAFRAGAAAVGRAELDAIYGHHPRHVYDLFRPERDAGGAVALFLHGGYWKALDKNSFSHMAAGLTRLGVPVAVAGYRLCPEAEISDIIGDARQMAVHLFRRLGRPLAVIGHSAGAHLAACLLATDWTARGFETRPVRAGMGISGVYDLRPLLATSHNQALRLDEMNAFAASPLLWPAPRGQRFALAVGGDESEEFIRQSRSLEAAWSGCGVAISSEVMEGENHFTIIGGLEEAASPLTRTAHALCLGHDQRAAEHRDAFGQV